MLVNCSIQMMHILMIVVISQIRLPKQCECCFVSSNLFVNSTVNSDHLICFFFFLLVLLATSQDTLNLKPSAKGLVEKQPSLEF